MIELIELTFSWLQAVGIILFMMIILMSMILPLKDKFWCKVITILSYVTSVIMCILLFTFLYLYL